MIKYTDFFQNILLLNTFISVSGLLFTGCNPVGKSNGQEFNLAGHHFSPISGFAVTSSNAKPPDTFYLPPFDVLNNPKPIEVDLKKPKTLAVELSKKPISGVPQIIIPGTDTILLPVTERIQYRNLDIGLPSVTSANDPLMKLENLMSFSFLTRSQGMPHDDISHMKFDNRGNLWIGTYGAGLVRFDGYNFYTYSIEEGLPDSFVLRVNVTSDGRILIGTRSEGLLIFDGENFSQIGRMNGLPASRVETIFLDRDENIWVGTFGGGVAKIANDSITVYDSRHGLAFSTIFDITQDLKGNMWFGTRGMGLSMYDGESFTSYKRRNGLPSNYITSLAVDNENRVWVGTNNGLAIIGEGEISILDSSNGLPENDVTALFYDHNGNIWGGSKIKGIWKFKNDTLHSFDQTDGLLHPYITCFEQDESGKIWFGSYGGGLGIFFGDHFRHFSENEGLPEGFIRNIAQDSEGSIWIAMNSNGILQINPEKTLLWNTQNGLPDNRARSVMQDSKKRWWFGFLNHGFAVLENERLMILPSDFWLSKVSVVQVFEASDGTIWLATNGDGLISIKGQKIIHYTINSGLSDNYIRKIDADSKGNIWIATRGGGILQWNGKQFIHYTTEEGLPINDFLDLIVDKNDVVWAGSNGSGLIILNLEKGFLVLNETHGLSSNYVYSVLQTRDERIWLGTRRGMSLLLDSAEHFSDYSDTGIDNSNAHQYGVYFENFLRNDGFMGIGVNSRSLMEDNNGAIWIGANDILTIFVPPAPEKKNPSPDLYFKWIGLFNEPINWRNLPANGDTVLKLPNGVELSGFSFEGLSKWDGIPQNLVLDHQNNYIVFSFNSVNSALSKDNRYQFFLEGMEESWGTLKRQTEVHYGNLPPGKYIFHLRAMDAQGNFSKNVAFSFQILYPWWKTWWALCIYGILFSGIYFSIFFYRRKLKQQQEKRKEEELLLQQQVEIARRAAEFKQNFLANMSHEIRTPLTGILGMADLMAKTGLTPVQEDYLKTLILSGENLKETINLVLDYSKIEAGKVKVNENSFATARLFDDAEKLFHSISRKSIQFEKNIAPDVPGFVISDFNRIFQIVSNLLSNAVKFTEQGKISLKMTLDRKSPAEGGNYIRIGIRDTGKGVSDEDKKSLFKPFYQVEQSYDRSFDGTGLGLAICKELSRILGGDIGFDSKLGVGSEFWFTFFAKYSADILPEKEIVTLDEEGIPRSLHILLVEDKMVNQKVVGLMLKSMKHRVTIAENGKIALELFEKDHFDLILMDIQMPVMDGITATRNLRMNHTHLPPIVGLSANAFEGDREKYMNLGMDDYLTKPVKESDFREIISKLRLV